MTKYFFIESCQNLFLHSCSRKLYIFILTIITQNHIINAYNNVRTDIGSLRSLQKDLKDISKKVSDDLTCPEVRTNLD